MNKTIAVVDLFAGPGGLGEGFSSLRITHNGEVKYPFRIALSVEKEVFARTTLRLRAYYRLLVLNDQPLDQYYGYLAGDFHCPYTVKTRSLWDESGLEALQLEIGSEASGRTLHARVRQIAENNDRWILVGGPPCQAYSLAGRARNKGKKDYIPEEDKRHFLYTHYLELIRRFRPPVFVMENVKGILSSKISGTGIFGRILEDLHAAGSSDDKSYRIYSLVKRNCVYTGPGGDPVDPKDFVVRSEKFGIPQARHRVILVGIRQDFVPKVFWPLKIKHEVTLKDAIGDLPKLRSGLSRNDSLDRWQEVVRKQARRVIDALDELDSADDRKRIRAALTPIAKGKLPYKDRGGLRVPLGRNRPSTFARLIQRDGKPPVILNHEARGHMEKDLARYLYAIAYGKVKGVSPSQENFPKELAPDHKNWFSGKFADRFRAQIRNCPSTTVTSHIAKDGNYYIHFDPKQCRSLTVREAARLQTFPDNYFFEGNRTEQYIQVGNAVPPLLARQIAKKVWLLFKG